jgi:hypothetical protein
MISRLENCKLGHPRIEADLQVHIKHLISSRFAFSLSYYSLTHSKQQASVPDADSSVLNMQFFTSTLVVAFIASVSALPTAETSLVARSLPITPSGSEVCPQANGLWYVAGKGYMYQVACGIDTTGTTLVLGQDGTSGSQHAENAIQCAE